MNEKTVQLTKKIYLSLSIIIISFSLDRFTKLYVIKNFIQNDFKDQFINEYLNLTLTWNKGIAFGFLQSDTIFYHLVSSFILLIIVFVIYLIFKSRVASEIICFSLIIGGALGNFFDRIYYNAVPDFIDLHYENFHWFTFNVSDICITFGIILLLIFDILKINLNKEK